MVDMNVLFLFYYLSFSVNMIFEVQSLIPVSTELLGYSYSTHEILELHIQMIIGCVYIFLSMCRNLFICVRVILLLSLLASILSANCFVKERIPRTFVTI